MNTHQADPKVLAHTNPKVLKEMYKIRAKHFLEFPSGRLVGTIISRERADGKVEVAASIVSPTQGQVVLAEVPGHLIVANNKDGKLIKKITTRPRPVREPAPTRAAGREVAMERLLSASAKERFTPEEAKKRLRVKVRDYSQEGDRPSDVKVVVFDHDELKKLIEHRQILSFFPGAKWVPKALRPRAPFKPRKNKPQGFLARVAAFFQAN